MNRYTTLRSEIFTDKNTSKFLAKQYESLLLFESL
jgi:hypothetical protein